MSIMFRGQYTHTIDAKGRTSLPARFRDQLFQQGEARVVLTPALAEPCIHVFPLSAWEELEQRVAALPSSQAVVQMRRRYVSAAVDCELDKQGRLLVPQQLREHAMLTHEVQWAGVGNKAELWSKERWDRATEMTPEQLAELGRQMAEWGL